MVESLVLRVAARFQREAAALSQEQMQALLLSLRKGAWGKINNISRLKEVLDYLGGWNLEPFVGLCQVHISKSTEYFNASREEVEKARDLLQKWEVRSLPTNPKIDEAYTMDVGTIEPAHGEFSIDFRLWIGAAGFKVTSPEGKILELLPDGDVWRRGRIWVDIFNLPKLGKKSGKYIRLYDVPGWLKNETGFEKQVLEALGMEAHKPAQLRTRENTGSCPCCFRNIKLKAASGSEHPLMVNHGFRRPGWGYILGNCIGVGFPPFELSPEGTKHLVDNVLTKRHTMYVKYLADLEAGRVKEITTEGFTRRTYTPDSPQWEGLVKNTVSQTKRFIEWLEEDLKTLKTLIAKWKPEPLPEPGKELNVLKLRSET